MGVYIPNMEKPKDCDLCPFADLFGICKDDCPLIEIDLTRCGECKHHDEDGWGYGNCQRPSVDYLRTADEDYCSYGERRTDEEMVTR